MLITVLKVEHEFTGGTMGLSVPGLFETAGIGTCYYTGLGLVVLFGVILIYIVNSKVGVYLQSIRDDEEVSTVFTF